jgi:hypothetical protein
MSTNIALQTINRKQQVKNPRGDLDFESLARSCLARGAHQLSPDQIKFIAGALQQIRWCDLTTEQSNRLLDLTILVTEGAQ